MRSDKNEAGEALRERSIVLAYRAAAFHRSVSSADQDSGGKKKELRNRVASPHAIGMADSANKILLMELMAARRLRSRPARSFGVGI